MKEYEWKWLQRNSDKFSKMHMNGDECIWMQMNPYEKDKYKWLHTNEDIPR